MNAIEIRDLSKSFRGMYAVDHLNMTVPGFPFAAPLEAECCSLPWSL